MSYFHDQQNDDDKIQNIELYTESQPIDNKHFSCDSDSESMPSTHQKPKSQKVKIKWFPCNAETKNMIELSYSTRNGICLINSSYKPTKPDYYKTDEIVIDNYSSSANDIYQFTDSKIYAGICKFSFEYCIINKDGKRIFPNHSTCSSFSAGFIPIIDLTGNFRIYDDYWKLIYNGELKAKKKDGYGIYYSNNSIIKGYWKNNNISGALKMFVDGVLKFSGNNKIKKSSQCIQRDDPKFLYENGKIYTEGEVIGNYVLPTSGMCKWYHSNGKLAYNGKMENGKRNSNFSVEFGKNGVIIYTGRYKDDFAV